MKCEMYFCDMLPQSAPSQSQRSYQTPESLRRSSSIIQPPVVQKASSEPIKFKSERSVSEIQLFKDEQEADYRDYCMYLRIAEGMLVRWKDDVIDSSLLDSIIRTRHAFNTMTPDLYLLDDEDHNTISETSASSKTPPLTSNVLFTTVSSMRRPATNESSQFLNDSPVSTLYYCEKQGAVLDEDSVLDDLIFALDF